MVGQGQALAAGQIGAAQAQAQGAAGIAGAIGGGVQNYMLMNALNKGGFGGGGGGLFGGPRMTNSLDPFQRTFGAGASPEG
jgi:hypothetical protein